MFTRKVRYEPLFRAFYVKDVDRENVELKLYPRGRNLVVPLKRIYQKYNRVLDVQVVNPSISSKRSPMMTWLTC